MEDQEEKLTTSKSFPLDSSFQQRSNAFGSVVEPSTRVTFGLASEGGCDVEESVVRSTCTVALICFATSPSCLATSCTCSGDWKASPK